MLHEHRAGEMTIRAPSVSRSTRAPSRRPARSAISLGMRRSRLLLQRATCTCIGLSIQARGIYIGYSAFAIEAAKGSGFGGDDPIETYSKFVLPRFGNTWRLTGAKNDGAIR